MGMPKKPERPQTHEEHEVQTIVDRIEKSASALSKRELRIVKRIGPAPCIAVCTSCNRQFTVMDTVVRTVEGAEASLQEQFDGHKCKPEDASQAAARVVKDATEGH